MADDSSSNHAPSGPALASHEIAESSRIIAETASDAIITIDTDSTILFVNRAAERIFGYANDEMVGASLTMLMPEYLRHVHRARLKNYVATGQRHIPWEAVELPGLHKSGYEIPLELSFGEFDKNGQRFFTGIARDITARKRDERRLALQHSVAQILANAGSLKEASSQLLQTICENLDWQVGDFWYVETKDGLLHLLSNWRDQSIPEISEFEEKSRQAVFPEGQGFPGTVWSKRKPIWIADFAVDVFPRSKLAARSNLHSAYGFPIIIADEVLGVIELFSRRMKNADEAMLETLIAIGSQIGQFIHRKNNEQQLLSALAGAQDAKLEAEHLSQRLSALQRISDAALTRFSVDEVIAESLNRVREVLNVDTVAILLLEAEGDELIAWAAQGLEEQVETNVRIPVGVGFAGKIIAENKPQIINDTDQADLYNPLLRRKGIKSLLGVPLVVEGRPIGVLHVGKLQSIEFRDEDVRLLELAAARIALAVENARLHEEQRSALAEAEAANKAKDEFLTILSHELRTPLTPIIGWIHMMQNGILPEADVTKVLSVINRNAYSLKRLINDLLDMSAIISGKMRIEETSVSIINILEESVDTMQPYAQDARVQLKLKAPGDAANAKVTGDRNRLIQAFCNIIHNAIKFSPAGGQVQVALEMEEDDIIVRVRDQGHGIPDHFLPYVFERFRQADGSRTRTFGGLGLGLALVKSFVEAHNGTVEAVSEGEGKGSTFVVTLPREPEQLDGSRDRPGQVARDVSQKPARVLVVEDEPDTLEMLCAVLERRGYEVVAQSSAMGAIEVFGQEEFDILISDLGMPSMDGIELIKTLRAEKNLPRVPTIALTGYASRKDAASALAAGFDVHMSKPVDPDELVTAVERLLSSRSGEQE